MIQSNKVVILGYTASDSSSVDIPNKYGPLGTWDAWLLNFNQQGNVLFSKCYGSSGEDDGCDMIQDVSGISFIGKGDLNDYDVSGVHTVTPWGGPTDLWFVKLDSINQITYQHCYGGPNSDAGLKLIKSRFGGYILAGQVQGNGGDVTCTNCNAFPDNWVVRMDDSGNILWSKALGNLLEDYLGGIVELDDGTIVLSGSLSDYSGDVTCYNPGIGIWVVKLDTLGNIIWDQCYGGSNADQVFCLLKGTDNTFYLGGLTYSNDGDITSVMHGVRDGWVVHMDSSGNILWNQCVGGIQADAISSMCRSFDNGLILGGTTFSPDVSNYHQMSGLNVEADAYVAKMDSMGNLIWQAAYGGTDSEVIYSITEDTDSNIVFTGYSKSHDGDLPFNHGMKDLWVVKLQSAPLKVNELSGPVLSLEAGIGNGNLTVKFNLYGSNEIALTMYDLLGRPVLSKAIHGDSGMNEIILPVNSNASGIYYLELRTKYGMVSEKIISIQ
ncbi:MAG: T9SS type A sorting domain-containing protein [Bacteroidia bacterium]